MTIGHGVVSKGSICPTHRLRYRIAGAIASRANKQEQVKVSPFQSSQFDRIFLQPLKATTDLAKIVL